ncbi:uncharacterized protein C3orf20-like isoform 2-T2 [Thomomys bottae]
MSTIILTEEKDDSHSLGFSESPNPEFSKTYLQNSLVEEYKLTAPEILYELGKTLQKYVEYKMTFPVEIANLINYSWQDLAEDTYKCVSTPTTLEQDKALQGDSSTIIDFNNVKISNNPKEEFLKENHLVKVKKGPLVVPSKSVGKMSFVSNSQSSQICQENNFSAVIHFSLSSKICLENGWISHHPYSKWEILQWKTLLSAAVKRLQVAIIQIKSEEAKLKKEGFNKQLILHHYNDPEQEEMRSSSQSSQSFWLELLEKKPQMPTVREADPEKKKFHYSLIDGSSLVYYPSGRLAVCQSYSDLPWGGMYTNIFSDLPDPVILGTFTPFGCGSISFPNRKKIAMMFNQNGGMVISRNGHIIREWMWPSKGKLEVPVEVEVNNFITVKISGRFAIILVYKWHPKSLKLSLAPVKHKSLPLCLADMPTSSADQLITSTIDSSMDISPLHDFMTSVKLRRLQRKAKQIFSHWLNHYRFSLGLEKINICQTPELPQNVTIKQNASFTTTFPVKQNIKESSEHMEYLHCQYTFQPLKNVFKHSPPCRIQRTLAINQTSRFSLPNESKDTWFGSLLICPVVLRQILCGKEEDICRCNPYSIPEVTDLEYDNLINNQLASTDQIIIVYVFSAKKNDKHIEEVTKIYRELNRSRTMPCVQSHLDPFRLLKYNIVSASKFTGSDCPLLVQRHNIIPGIFLMYVQGKLVFANFIFNGYSTSAKDLKKQIVKTKNDYHMGYFLPKDYRIGQF